jgi:hypothetical protein
MEVSRSEVSARLQFTHQWMKQLTLRSLLYAFALPFHLSWSMHTPPVSALQAPRAGNGMEHGNLEIEKRAAAQGPDDDLLPARLSSPPIRVKRRALPADRLRGSQPQFSLTSARDFMDMEAHGTQPSSNTVTYALLGHLTWFPLVLFASGYAPRVLMENWQAEAALK